MRTLWLDLLAHTLTSSASDRPGRVGEEYNTQECVECASHQFCTDAAFQTSSFSSRHNTLQRNAPLGRRSSSSILFGELSHSLFSDAARACMRHNVYGMSALYLHTHTPPRLPSSISKSAVAGTPVNMAIGADSGYVSKHHFARVQFGWQAPSPIVCIRASIMIFRIMFLVARFDIFGMGHIHVHCILGVCAKHDV